MKNILLADNDENFRFTIKEYFSDSPWHWDMVENGVLALDYALKKKYDLILLDINIPFMQGTEIIKAIKSQWPEIHVLAFTVDSADEKTQEYYKDGFEWVMTKPVQLVKLHQMISNFLDPHTPIQPSHEKGRTHQKPLEKSSALESPVSKKNPIQDILESTSKKQENLVELPPHILMKNMEALTKENKELLEKIKNLENEIEILKMARHLKSAPAISTHTLSLETPTLPEPQEKPTEANGKTNGIPTFEIE
jgi:CheY-like chemotaxis protein